MNNCEIKDEIDKSINKKGWIGIDLDGTLAHYESGQGLIIGKPIKQIVDILNKFLNDGYEVRIFTARASIPELIPDIKEWLIKNNLPDLKITNKKDFEMKLLIDDRCKQVISNTGIFVGKLMKDSL